MSTSYKINVTIDNPREMKPIYTFDDIKQRRGLYNNREATSVFFSDGRGVVLLIGQGGYFTSVIEAAFCDDLFTESNQKVTIVLEGGVHV